MPGLDYPHHPRRAQGKAQGSGPLFPSMISVMGIDGKSTCPLATGPLPCLLDNSPITHSFLVMLSCPVPLLGQDILTKLGATLQLTQSPSASLLLPLLAPSLHGNTDPPLPASLVNAKFPISLTHQRGLKPLITRLLGQGLLIPINSPCNTPILPVRKADRTYRLVQDLRLINEAVVPIHPMVPNPYTLLSRIPSGTTHFSVLDLKDAFFTIPLDPDSYHLFAFTWENPDEQVSCQLTWTVLPQGFRDSPHLFGQALARDLQQCSLEPSTLLQYVDDLLCSPSLDISQRQTAGLLNFLGDKGYHISKPFQLFTDEKQGIAMGVLTQPLGPAFTPEAYLSRQFDPTVRGWQPCLRALAEAAVPETEHCHLNSNPELEPWATRDVERDFHTAALTKEAQKICLQQPLQELHLLFLESPDISLTHSPALNPATLLPAASTQPVATHSCPEVVETLTQLRAGLSDLPFSNPDLTLFVDGSSCPDPQGCRKASYAVVTLERILEAAQLPEGTTSQKAELIALTRALHLSKGRRVHQSLHIGPLALWRFREPLFTSPTLREAVTRPAPPAPRSFSGNMLTGFYPCQNQLTMARKDHPSSPGTQFSLRIYIPRPWNPALGNLHPPPPAYVWRFKVRETYDQDSTQDTQQIGSQDCPLVGCQAEILIAVNLRSVSNRGR
ncbi:hypothetical protein QTO34_016949 [Cnephaeus nilssonii]|uniref:Reverse transcriptase domain-containing protein n=1 Tax=Cnephaeus nilssonii TaxID=3371016 RepID=A0AA40I440_CNENI|nr:hypothetical protein QTO34_016949 [Eptesicus nilssonii]